MKEAAENTIDVEAIELLLFRSDGNLLENDWEENPDGQGYFRAAVEAGHRSATEWANRVFTLLIAQSNR